MTKKKEHKETAAPAEGAIVKLSDGPLANLAESHPMFQEKYKEDLERVSATLPSPASLQKIIEGMPENIRSSVSEIIKKTSGKKRGVYTEDNRPDFPELRLFHGSGNDPNKPENVIPGHFYLNTKENVGAEFKGAVIAIWAGRTMWGDRDGGDSGMPICQSMNRVVGSTYGTCKTCPHRPWRGGEKQKCGDDVVAFMLTEDLKELVLVRFNKTSEPAGRRLLRMANRDMELWSKWYSITSDARTSKQDKNWRWFVMQVEPVEDGLVPESVYDFCGAMCTLLEASIVLPKIADTYNSAQKVLSGEEEVEEDEPGAGEEDLMKEDDDYGDMPEDGESENV
jgi:hypothetical protein